MPTSSEPRGSSPPAGAGALVAAADGRIKLLHAALLLRLVAVEAEAIGKPLGAHRGGHRSWC
jgi:hypothetical protein